MSKVQDSPRWHVTCIRVSSFLVIAELVSLLFKGVQREVDQRMMDPEPVS